MIRFFRTVATAIVAALTAMTMLIWIQAPGRDDPRPQNQLATTFDTAVGMVDLYWRDDIRGYERLVDEDPGLDGVGGDAARSVALDRAFELDHRRDALRRLVRRQGPLSEEFAQKAVASIDHEDLIAFQGIDPNLDTQIIERLDPTPG